MKGTSIPRLPGFGRRLVSVRPNRQLTMITAARDPPAAQVQSASSEHPGARRKVRLQRRIPSRRVAIETLEAVSQRGALAAAAQLVLERENACADSKSQKVALLRFPLAEFRSLCLNPLAKGSAPMLDRGTWNRHKVELAQLALQLADGSHEEWSEELERVVDVSLVKEHRQLQQALSAPDTTQEQKDKLAAKFETRRARLVSQFAQWCRAIVSNPDFYLLKPVVEQVLVVNPAPVVDNKRDGQQTELTVCSLVEAALPPGWRIYSQCRICSVDGETFRNVKMLKGEADVLITDPHGIVQAILEIKTAKGNPYLALYEDVTRLLNMTERTKGRLVTFVPGHGLPPGTPMPGGPVPPEHLAVGCRPSQAGTTTEASAAVTATASAIVATATGAAVPALPSKAPRRRPSRLARAGGVGALAQQQRDISITAGDSAGAPSQGPTRHPTASSASSLAAAVSSVWNYLMGLRLPGLSQPSSSSAGVGVSSSRDATSDSSSAPKLRARSTSTTATSNNIVPLQSRLAGKASSRTKARSSQSGSSSSSSSGSDSDSEQAPVVTLRFSKSVKPIYVLGSSIAPKDLESVVRSAESKLLTMEFGRVLSTQMSAWKDVSVVEVNPDWAILKVPIQSIPQCLDNVHRYFQRLQSTDIFMVGDAKLK